jgi:hypothetical protein
MRWDLNFLAQMGREFFNEIVFVISHKQLLRETRGTHENVEKLFFYHNQKLNQLELSFLARNLQGIF